MTGNGPVYHMPAIRAAAACMLHTCCIVIFFYILCLHDGLNTLFTHAMCHDYAKNLEGEGWFFLCTWCGSWRIYILFILRIDQAGKSMFHRLFVVKKCLLLSRTLLVFLLVDLEIYVLSCSYINHCTLQKLVPYQHFSTKSIQNTATDSVSKTKLPYFCAY